MKKKYEYVMGDILSPEEELTLASYISDNGITILGENNYKIVHTAIEYEFKHAGTVDLLAGHTCPAASLCHSRVIQDSNGHRTIEDLGKFRCYATKSEVIYKNVYDLHKRNEDITKLESFPLIMTYIIRKKRLSLVRIHSSGDFYDFEYFKKWMIVASYNPTVTFFGYTKQATFVRYLLNHLPENMRIVYSFGGIHDGYAINNNLPSCTVVTNDFAYHASKTVKIEKTQDGYLYTNIIGRKRGKDITVTVLSPVELPYGTFYNVYKNSIENLSCMHDSSKQKVDDFERIMRLESFGILFH